MEEKWIWGTGREWPWQVRGTTLVVSGMFTGKERRSRGEEDVDVCSMTLREQQQALCFGQVLGGGETRQEGV